MKRPKAEPASALERLDRAWSRPPGLFGVLAAVNHRAIGKRYLITASAFFVVAGVLALAMRVQLARPELDVLTPEMYNQFFTIHGTAMMFLFAVPVLEGIGIYLVPLMIGARDMVFPRLNALGYWIYLIAGVALITSLLAGRAPDGGWVAYPPFTGPSFSPGIGLDIWVAAITFLEVAALVAAVELIITTLKLRARGMSMVRAPLFVWAQLVMSVMIVFAMPPLIVASVMLGLDRVVGTHFFNPAAGGDPLLWQHLFWIFGHPDVYIILVPALGIVSTAVVVFARRRIVGYTPLVLSFVAIGFLSFGLWVHHMYTTGLPFLGLGFFAAASMMIAIPSGVQIFAYIATIWQGRPRLSTAFLFTAAFILVFVVGGMTGVMVAAVPFDWQVHDSYFVVAHFHYVLIGGAVFPLFAGMYLWFPKLTGRLLSERVGTWSFWIIFIGFNVAFFPMHELGMEGMPRRVYTYLEGAGWGDLNLVATIGAFAFAIGVLLTLLNAGWSRFFGETAGDDPWEADTLEWATSSPPPNYNFAVPPRVRSRHPLWDDGDDVDHADAVDRAGTGETADLEGAGGLEDDAPDGDDARGGDSADGTPSAAERPWRETLATTVLDARPDFRRILPGPSSWPVYLALALTLGFLGSLVDLVLVPIGAALAFVALVGWLWPNRSAWADRERHDADRPGELPVVVSGARAPEWWGILSLIVIEGVVFASLIVSYFYLRFQTGDWPLGGIEAPELVLPTINTGILLVSVVPIWWGRRRIRRGDPRGLRLGLVVGIVLLGTFLALKIFEYSRLGYDWSTNAYGSIVFTITGLHIAHVIAVLLKSGTVTAMAWRGFFSDRQYVPVESNALYWYFVAGIWIPLYATIYLSPRLV